MSSSAIAIRKQHVFMRENYPFGPDEFRLRGTPGRQRAHRMICSLSSRLRPWFPPASTQEDAMPAPIRTPRRKNGIAAEPPPETKVFLLIFLQKKKNLFTFVE
jgi:hypothetical protein